MTEKPNFVKLGMFLLLAIALVVGAIILFGAGVFAKEKIYFETYFAGSVHGLTRGSPVEENGVELGIVESVTFVRDFYTLPPDESGVSEYDRYVRVVCSVSEERLPKLTLEERKELIATRATRGLRLRLDSNMITSQAYLQAIFLEPKRSPTMEILWEPIYLYVPSAPGTFTTLKESVDQILYKIEELDFKKIEQEITKLLGSLNQVVNDADVKGLSTKVQRLVDTTNQAVEDANVGALSGDIKGLVAEVRQTNRHLINLLADSDVDMESNNIPELVAQFNQTLWRIDGLVAREAPKVDNILEDLQRIVASLKQLAENLEKNPSSLMMGQPPSEKEALK